MKSLSECNTAARALWDADRRLRYAFADFGTFLQAQILHGRQYDGHSNAAALDAKAEREALEGLARMRNVRDPLFAEDSFPRVVRCGTRLVVWIYGGLVAGETKYPGEISAGEIAAAIASHRDALVLVIRLSSPGGSMEAFDYLASAIQTYNGRSIALIDHFAYSAAAFLAFECNRIIARRNSLLMIHRVSCGAYGNCLQLRERVRELSMGDARLLKRILRRVDRKDHPKVAAAFEDERFIGAPEALELGLIDAISPPLLESDELIRLSQTGVTS